MKKHNYTQYFKYVEGRAAIGAYVYLASHAPPELGEFVRSVHRDDFGGARANDWIYSVIYEAFGALQRNDLGRITIGRDPCPNGLVRWLCEPYAVDYCNGALEGMGSLEGKDILSLISHGQERAKRVIYNAVNDFMEAHGQASGHEED